MNEILHHLANRGTGFIWPRFPVDPSLRPLVLPEQAQRVHDALKLSDQDTDYFVLGLLQALAASPWILEDIADPEDLQDIAYYPVPKTGWAGATLVAGTQGVSGFSRRPTVWPVELRILIEYLSDNESRITTGVQSWAVPSLLSPVSGYLQIEWPEEFQAAGLLDVGGTWTSGSTVEIQHAPGAYPYDAVIEHLTNLRETNQLLLDWALATAWQGARSSLERLALLASALIKTYRAAC